MSRGVAKVKAMPERTRAAMSAETKRRILDAAREEFASHGLAGSRVDRIALAAKANKQLIYHYFDDKQGLYDAVLTELVLLAREEQLGAREKGLSYARDFIGSSHMDTAAQSTWARLLGWEGLTDAPEDPVLENIRRDNFRALVNWLEKDQESGLVSNQFSAKELYAFALAATIFPYILPNVFTLLFDTVELSTQDLASWRSTVSRLLQGIR